MTDNIGNRLSRTSRGSLVLYWAIAFIIAAVYAVVSFLTPYYLDDWSFMGIWRDDVEGGSSFSWKVWKDYYLYIRSFDNGRIANGLAPFSTMLSPWKELFPWLTGLCVGWTAVLVQRFACRKPALPAAGVPNYAFPFLLSLVWALMIVCLPWKDTLMVRDYSLNYLWAAAITLSFLLFLAESMGVRLFSGRLAGRTTATAAAFCLAVIAGGWHEGFAIPTLCGLGLLALSCRRKLPGRYYAVCIVYLLSALAFMLSPGLMGRAAFALDSVHNPPGIRATAIIIIDALLAIVFLITVPRRVWKVWLSPAMIVCIGIVAGGYLLGYRSTNTPRSYFYPILASICIGVRLAYFILTAPAKGTPASESKKTVMPVRLCTWLLLLLCGAQSALAIIWQNAYRKESDRIMALLDDSATGTVFYDYTLPQYPPFLTFGIPTGNYIWNNPWHYAALWSYYITPVIGVVPTELQDASPSAETPRYSSTNSGASRRIAPEFMEGGVFAIPFITQRGDTLLYLQTGI